MGYAQDALPHDLKQSLPPLPTAAEIRRSEYAMGRRLRWARRSAGYATAAAYARVFDLPASAVRRLERGQMRLTRPLIRVLEPLCAHHTHSFDRLMFGCKPSPDSILGRAMRGDREMLARLKANGPRGAALATQVEARLAAERRR